MAPVLDWLRRQGHQDPLVILGKLQQAQLLHIVTAPGIAQVGHENDEIIISSRGQRPAQPGCCIHSAALQLS